MPEITNTGFSGQQHKLFILTRKLFPLHDTIFSGMDEILFQATKVTTTMVTQT